MTDVHGAPRSVWPSSGTSPSPPCGPPARGESLVQVVLELSSRALEARRPACTAWPQHARTCARAANAGSPSRRSPWASPSASAAPAWRRRRLSTPGTSASSSGTAAAARHCSTNGALQADLVVYSIALCLHQTGRLEEVELQLSPLRAKRIGRIRRARCLRTLLRRR
eukprot:685581-Pleurochrysis_carterae.AAC.1